MGTMIAGEPPMTGVDSPFLGSAHRGPKPSIPKQDARPRDLTPLGRWTEVYARPYVVMGRNDATPKIILSTIHINTREPKRQSRSLI
jgi:hypothetical protein